MKFFRKRPVAPLGYTLIEAGDAHRCRLPSPRYFARGAAIKCDACERTARLLYSGFVGNYWDGEMVANG